MFVFQNAAIICSYVYYWWVVLYLKHHYWSLIWQFSASLPAAVLIQGIVTCSFPSKHTDLIGCCSLERVDTTLKPSNISRAFELDVYGGAALPADTQPVHSALHRDTAARQMGWCVYREKYSQQLFPKTINLFHIWSCCGHLKGAIRTMFSIELHPSFVWWHRKEHKSTLGLKAS